MLLVPEDEGKKTNQVEATSDGNGVARFGGVKSGRYYVQAIRLGVEVGPGTVIVSPHGSAEPIAVEWPLRPAFTVVAVAGRFQRHLYRRSNPIDGFIHPQVGPLAATKLTLSRIDTEKQVGSVTTDSDGNFDFHFTEPGAYLLHIQEDPSPDFAYPIDDYLLLYVEPSSARGDLRLQVDWTSCGIKTADIQ